MAAFPNLNSDAGLKKLDDHLLTRYFITSHKASKDDITVYAALSKPPPSQYVNASRWYNHMETLLSISGISSERNGVTIDGSASITVEAFANPEDGVVVVSGDDNDQDVELIGEEEKKAADEERAASLTATTEKKVSWGSMVIVIIPENGETDLKKLEEDIRCIQMEGVIWVASKLVPLGYGVELLRIVVSCPEDEEIDRFEELVEDHIMALGRFRVETCGLRESLILIKPNDDEADMKKLEEAVRSIQVSGLFWGASKLVPVGYGIKLLGIMCTKVGHLLHRRRMVPLDTIVKEEIIDNRYAHSYQILGCNKICNEITEEESDSKDDDLYGEERAAGKSGLVLRRLKFDDKPDIKKAEEAVRSNQMAGVVWRASKIVNAGYGFKYLVTIYTIVDDRLCPSTVIRTIGGIPLNRICKHPKSFFKLLRDVLMPKMICCFFFLLNLALNNHAEDGKKNSRGKL